MSILDLIYQKRDDDLYQHNAQDKKYISEINKLEPVTYEELLIAIKNLPPHFGNTRENILGKLERYVERENNLVAYDNEKFYKNGFCDGVNLIYEVLRKEI